MANWDFVFIYNEESEIWRTNKGYKHPRLERGNRPPTTADMKWALEEKGYLAEDSPIQIDDNFDWKDEEYIPPSG